MLTGGFTTQHYNSMATLYKHILRKNPVGMIGLSAAEITVHQDAKTDYETTYKAQSVLVSGVTLADTAFEQDKTYTQFKKLIVAPILWSDVKYMDGTETYILYLLVA